MQHTNHEIGVPTIELALALSQIISSLWWAVGEWGIAQINDIFQSPATEVTEAITSF